MPLQSIYWKDGKIVIIDQTKLPHTLEYKVLNNLNDVVDAIMKMRVRGAPLLGVTAALALAMVAYQNIDASTDILMKKIFEAGEKLKKTRPTAINLFWAIDRVLRAAENSRNPGKAVIEEALKIFNESIQECLNIAKIGQEVVEDGDILLTHCNTGSLATVVYGTALGIILYAAKLGKKIKVFVTETRPVMQGARLTTYELLNEGIETHLIPDTAVGYTMKKKGIKKVLVGADRILRDGTTYNKIGTYQIAILAKYHNIDFYVVAPTSTFDLKSTREEVKIEERSKDEVIKIYGKLIAPKDVLVFNPAFDETPPELITGIITEYKILKQPLEVNIVELFREVEYVRH